MDKYVQIDTHLVQILTWVLGFLMLSLISIIVWLAKTMNQKMDSIGTKQDNLSMDVSALKNQIGTVTGDVAEIYKKLEDVPELSRKTTIVEQMLLGIKDDMSFMKIEHSEFVKELSELKRVSAVNAEWIRMTERQNKHHSNA